MSPVQSFTSPLHVEVPSLSETLKMYHLARALVWQTINNFMHAMLRLHLYSAIAGGLSSSVPPTCLWLSCVNLAPCYGSVMSSAAVFSFLAGPNKHYASGNPVFIRYTVIIMCPVRQWTGGTVYTVVSFLAVPWR
jgi:hypothetical protein